MPSNVLVCVMVIKMTTKCCSCFIAERMQQVAFFLRPTVTLNPPTQACNPWAVFLFLLPTMWILLLARYRRCMDTLWGLVVYILQVDCYDHDETGDNDLIGSFETTVDQLKSGVDNQVKDKLFFHGKQNGSKWLHVSAVITPDSPFSPKAYTYLVDWNATLSLVPGVCEALMWTDEFHLPPELSLVPGVFETLMEC